jgi:MFS family permease
MNGDSMNNWVRTFAGVFAAVWCSFAAFGVVVPLVPRLLGSATAVGVAFATTAAVALLLRPWGGRLAQRFGARATMTAGALLAVGTGAVYALPAGTPGVFAARAAMGVAEALLMTAGSVWALSLAPSSRRAQVVGLYGLAMWGGLAAGPVLGELAFRAGSYPAAWVVATALPAVAALVLVRLPRHEPSDAPVSSRLLPGAAVLPGLALAAGGFGYATVTSFGALAMSERGIAGGAVLLSLFSAAYVGVRLLAGRLPDRVGPLPMIVASAVLEASGLLVIALAPSLAPAAIGAVIAGGGFTLLYPSLALIAVDNAPEAERGATLGAVSSFLDLSIGVAGLAGGVVAGVSYPAVFILAAALALAGVAAARAAITGRSASGSRPSSSCRWNSSSGASGASSA